MNIKHTDRKPAVFLDRDGVLTEEKGHICSLKELHIFPYARECIRQIREKGYYAIVITNQSGVARGLFTESRLIEMNDYLKRVLDVDAVYYCPHYPEGKVKQYAVACNCRKPGTGMIEKACKDFRIDMENSFLAGDRASDIIAGKRAGIRTVLLESGYGTAGLEEDVEPDYRLNDLRDIIRILEESGGRQI